MKLRSRSLATTLLMISLTISILSCGEKDERLQYYENGLLKSSVGLKNGMHHGKYESFYEDGRRKAIGYLHFNKRIGKWRVWNEKNQLAAERIYKKSLEVTDIFALEEDEFVKKEALKDFSWKRDEDGLWIYPHIVESDVYIAKRIWRFIPTDTLNDHLFSENHLNPKWIKDALNSSITIYKTEDLITPIEATERLEKMEVDCQFIGLKIIVDFLYNRSLLFSENRIISICPIFKYHGGFEEELGWFYYPDLRKKMAIKKAPPTPVKDIENMDDIFQFDYYYSTIYKEENVYDQPLADRYGEEKVKEHSDRIEMEILDVEHDCWINRILL